MTISWNELRDARERLHLTQAQLAHELGVATRTITNWEAAGVPRKAEYKVRSFLGGALVQQSPTPPNVDSFRPHRPQSAWQPNAMSSYTDEELLSELLLRAQRRTVLEMLSAQSGERAENVTPLWNDMQQDTFDPDSIDLSQYEGAADDQPDTTPDLDIHTP